MAKYLILIFVGLCICQAVSVLGDEVQNKQTQIVVRQSPFPWFKWLASFLSIFSPGSTQDILNKNWSKSLQPLFQLTSHNVWSQLIKWLPWLLWVSFANPNNRFPIFKNPPSNRSPSYSPSSNGIPNLGNQNLISSSLSNDLGPMPLDVLQATGGLPY